MNIQKILAIALIVAGSLGLAYGGFDYTRDTHTAELGSLSVSVDEKEHINIPVWGGIGLIFVGGLLLVWRRKT
jgi:drug/metabolite transporter (DMT)-like permease